MDATSDTIKEMEIRIGNMELVQFGACGVSLVFAVDPGCPEERATFGDPGSPGSAPECEIHQVILRTPMVFAESAIGDVPYLTIAPGANIYDLLASCQMGKKKIEAMEEEILNSKEEAAYEDIANEAVYGSD